MTIVRRSHARFGQWTLAEHTKMSASEGRVQNGVKRWPTALPPEKFSIDSAKVRELGTAAKSIVERVTVLRRHNLELERLAGSQRNDDFLRQTV
jgi:hypothetical protein